MQARERERDRERERAREGGREGERERERERERGRGRGAEKSSTIAFFLSRGSQCFVGTVQDAKSLRELAISQPPSKL